ncbi:MAG: hypothetical protein M3290_10695 [Actinomycetota bacterium]|nr:hypothetical protein [Actinomycetota bacterium]
MGETTIIFIEGLAATVCAIIVFCGSVWLLLTLVTGARLAYFITASVTLGVLVILGVVWSLNPLGPVGELPKWNPVQYADSVDKINFGPASSYPDSPWTPVNKNDTAQAQKGSLLESGASGGFGDAINKGQVTVFTTTSQGLINSDLDRFLDQGGTTYGMVTFEAVTGKGSAVALLKYDPGNALGPPRQLTGWFVGLFVLHLFGLSWAERKARPQAKAPEGAAT